MYGDLVSCNNCSTENMIIETGSDICPICGAVGTLSWADEENQEVNEVEDKILKLQPHIYHPGHDAYGLYQCSECGFFDMGFYNYTRKQAISFENLTPELLEPKGEFIEKDDDGFFKFYKIPEDDVLYVELCPESVLKNIVKLYGKDVEYYFSKDKVSTELDFFEKTEHILKLNVVSNGRAYIYEVHSATVKDDFNKLEKKFFNEILNKNI